MFQVKFEKNKSYALNFFIIFNVFKTKQVYIKRLKKA